MPTPNPPSEHPNPSADEDADAPLHDPPNPGDPGPETPSPPTWGDPFADPRVPPQDPTRRGPGGA